MRQQTAQEFENVQQMGGAWHDSLTLRVVAHDELGKRSKLVAVFARHEEATLKDFRATLGAGGRGVRLAGVRVYRSRLRTMGDRAVGLI